MKALDVPKTAKRTPLSMQYSTGHHLLLQAAVIL
jgi:hypothetical protein